MAAMARLTDWSESTSMVETVIGSFSREAVAASSEDCDGLRIVAWTLWPARPKASAASNPMPLLVPVISTDAMLIPLDGWCRLSNIAREMPKYSTLRRRELRFQKKLKTQGQEVLTVFYAVLQLTLVLRAVEVALRGGDEPVGTNLPKLETTNADPVPFTSRPGVSAEQRPMT